MISKWKRRKLKIKLNKINNKIRKLQTEKLGIEILLRKGKR